MMFRMVRTLFLLISMRLGFETILLRRLGICRACFSGCSWSNCAPRFRHCELPSTLLPCCLFKAASWLNREVPIFGFGAPFSTLHRLKRKGMVSITLNTVERVNYSKVLHGILPMVMAQALVRDTKLCLIYSDAERFDVRFHHSLKVGMCIPILSSLIM